MKAILRLSAILLVAQSVAASQCSDGCNANCQYAKSICEVASIPDFLKKICPIVTQVCDSGCDVVCGCADKCLPAATEQFLKCRGEKVTDILLATGCQGLYIDSVLLCSSQCGISSLAGIATQLPKLLLSYATGFIGPALLNMAR